MVKLINKKLEVKMNKPLAYLLRPKNIEEIVGQAHLLGENKALRKIIESKNAVNLAFYGPPDTGKTTLAEIIAKNSNKTFRKLNCTTSGTSDIKEIISEIGAFGTQNGVLLHLDEIQYFNKKQQQTLLEFIENGKITVIVSTTENPYFYIYSALLSRMTVFEFKSVHKDKILKALNRAVSYLQKEHQNLNAGDGELTQIAYPCGGDVRKSLNILELAVISSNPQAITFVKSCVDIAFQVGLPEARIPLADAVIMVCFSPKSNSAYNAINKAVSDVRSGKTGPIPRHLQNKHFDGKDAEIKWQNYLYPHDFENHFMKRQYLPDNIKSTKYYEFCQNKNEQSFKIFWEKIKKRD